MRHLMDPYLSFRKNSDRGRKLCCNPMEVMISSAVHGNNIIKTVQIKKRVLE